MTIRIRLNTDEQQLLVDALSFYRMANIDIAEPLDANQGEIATEAEVLALEQRILRER